MTTTTREIRLASRPDGEPTEENFELAEVEIGEPGPGEMLVRNSYLSVDPYMRGRMRDVKSYIPPFQIGAALDGGAVGQVVASNGGQLEEGAWIQHLAGWREHSVIDGGYPVDPAVAPISTSASSKFSSVGSPSGREARRISRLVALMTHDPKA